MSIGAIGPIALAATSAVLMYALTYVVVPYLVNNLPDVPEKQRRHVVPAIVAALIFVIVLQTVSARIYVPSSSSSPPSQETRGLSAGQILSPKSRSSVPRLFKASGTLQQIPSNYHVWSAVRIGSLFWPKEPELSSNDGSWEHDIIEGGSPPAGRFSLILFMVGPMEHERLLEWVGKGQETGSWPGLGNISGTQLDLIEDLVLEDEVSILH
jgi:hypothetical protein